MKYEIVELEEKVVAGIKIKTTNQDGKAMQDIGITWQRLFTDEIYERIKNKVNNKTIGLYTEYEGDYTKPYIFIAGAEVSKRGESNKEIVRKVIPKGKYAKFIITGDVQNSVGQAWQEIWNIIILEYNRSYFLIVLYISAYYRNIPISILLISN